MSFANASYALELFLDKVKARSTLSTTERNALLSLPTIPRQFGAHREIVRIGECVDHACLIADGFVSRFAQMEDGRRQTISVHIGGDMVDLYSLMLPAVPTPLVALTPTTVFQIPHVALRELSFRYPAVAAAFWRECAVDGTIIAEWLISTGRRDARGRLAHLLCEMAVRNNQIGRYNYSRFPFPMTQEHIADALGLTSVHVNRTLQGLRSEGLVDVSRREVIVRDWNGLVFAGEFDPGYLHLRNLPIAAGLATRR